MRQPCAILVAAILVLPLAAEQASGTYEALKAGWSTYFTTKTANLSQKLQLNPDQKDRPVTEQEVGYLQEIRANPALSVQDKLKKLKTILQSSDAQMKPMLSSEQWQKLQELRKQQKQQLKEFAVAGRTSGG
jgi:hypothetical protein